MKLSKFLTTILLIACILSTAFSAPKPVPKPVKQKAAMQNNFSAGDFFNFFGFILKLFGQKSGYRKIERIMAHQPEDKLPREYRTPAGAHVHSVTPPSAQELQIIDEAIAEVVRHTSVPFKVIQPADEYKNWTKYRNPSEYRIWLVETPDVVPAINPDIKGCPILLTYSGYASGITADFKIIDGKIKAVYPFSATAKLSAANLQDERCVGLYKQTLINEFDHWRTANNTTVYLWFKQNDIHPFEF